MTPKQPIKIKDAMQRMRELTQANIPFSIGFITYNESNQTSKGYKLVDKALLRPGYRKNQSKKSNVLIAYTDEAVAQPRHFYLPLLLMFNGHTINS